MIYLSLAVLTRECFVFFWPVFIANMVAVLTNRLTSSHVPAYKKQQLALCPEATSRALRLQTGRFL